MSEIYDSDNQSMVQLLHYERNAWRELAYRLAMHLDREHACECENAVKDIARALKY